jgi:glycerophosphoryl diester phosphodiesterase
VGTNDDRECIDRLAAGLQLDQQRAGDARSVPSEPVSPSKMLVIAHAGGEGLGPANTIEARRLSMAAGADGNDVDVHVTADGVLVAIHDDTVDATTNGKGFVRDKTFAEVEVARVARLRTR